MSNTDLTAIELDENQDVDLIIRRNNYKLTADKIKQILSKVLNDPSKSKRRWIWELMQNAKDLPHTAFNRVSIQIILKEDELLFKHNGDPFKMANITGLIQQVSSKASDSSDDKITGKFGTGFISTHLLSEIINVSGIVDYKNTFRNFELMLDRTGRTSEELLPKIQDALERIRQIEDTTIFPPAINYERNRSEDSYETIFSYSLTTAEKRKAANAGVEDLVHSLPITLVNIPKIKQVEVINEVAGTTVTYLCNEESKEDSVRKVKVNISGDNLAPERHFVVYCTEHIELIAEVNNFTELTLIESFGEQPNLYRDFPLIGSEKFYFPFTINGTQFFPTEDRDGIYLNSEESPDAIENRLIIEGAINASIDFTRWLVEHNAKNRYVCAFSRLPDYKWEDFSKEWYTKLQREWRKQLLEIKLVETQDDTIIKLAEAIIPNYGANDEVKLMFHDLVIPFLGSTAVPRKAMLLKWIKATGPKIELEEWGFELRCDLKLFLNKLEDQNNINKIEEFIELDANTTTLKWLNKIYNFIIDERESDLLNDYAIIPNQYGYFHALEKLYLDDSNSPISDHFLDILKNLGLDWRVELIDREVLLPGLNVNKKGMSDISDEINRILQTERERAYNQNESLFLKSANALEILVEILRVIEPNATKESFRCKLFSKARQLFEFEQELIEIPDSANFNYSPAIRLLIQLINEAISNEETVIQLSKRLQLSENETVAWLDDYLILLNGKSDYKVFLENGNIIPNRYGELTTYEEIAHFGTSDTPLDDTLLEILHRLNSSKDWKSRLVCDGISVTLPNSIKFD